MPRKPTILKRTKPMSEKNIVVAKAAIIINNYAETGRRFNLSRERVRQIVKQYRLQQTRSQILY